MLLASHTSEMHWCVYVTLACMISHVFTLNNGHLPDVLLEKLTDLQAHQDKRLYACFFFFFIFFCGKLLV